MKKIGEGCPFSSENLNLNPVNSVKLIVHSNFALAKFWVNNNTEGSIA